MGIPTLLRSIIQNKFYKNVHAGVKEGSLDCDYFFMDYNGIVYKAYERIKKKFEGQNFNKNEIENMLIEEVIDYTRILISEVVKPRKYTYIAMDGPAPRAKMIQQRSRRYKGAFDKIVFQEEKKRLKLPINENEWDKSANISPGTEFMQKLSTRLISSMKAKVFSKHSSEMKVVLSDSNVPGEGEQKILPFIRTMLEKKSTENLKCYIYGSDGDLIVLAVSTHKNNIHIIRETEELYEIAKEYEGYRFIQLNINQLSSAFNHDLTRTFKEHVFDKDRILTDYVFLTFLAGNDFVLSLPFLKIKKEGLKTLIAIYHDIKLNHSGYLIEYDYKNKESDPIINEAFFKELIFNISKKEDHLMKQHQNEIDKYLKGFRNPSDFERESKQTPFEIFSSRYQHLFVCSPDHPLFSKYRKEFDAIDFKEDFEIWRNKYYTYYTHVNTSNEEDYMKIKYNMTYNYLESLVFNLKYYFKGCPSWNYHYKFRVPPLFTDIYYMLEHNLINVNQITFELGKPYTPFQQLMIILPPQMSNLIPTVLRPIMNDDKLLCTQFYPTDFRLDVTTTLKSIYSEAILPEIDESILIPVIEKYEEKCSEKEKMRNVISERAKMV
jgi:5'-3' exonuclease